MSVSISAFSIGGSPLSAFAFGHHFLLDLGEQVGVIAQ
jgi:hypothetical protein